METDKIAIKIITEFDDYFEHNIYHDRSKPVTINLLISSLNNFTYDAHELRCWCKPIANSIQNISYVEALDDKLLSFLLFDYWSTWNEFEVIFTKSKFDSSSFYKIAKSKPLQFGDNDICPFSKKPVSDISINDRLIIENKTHTVIVDSNYILDFIQSELKRNCLIFEIVLNAITATGSHVFIVLNESVWSRCLLSRHKNADELLKIFTEICERSISYEKNLKSFQHNKADLFMKIKIFLSDLMNFKNDADARQRLEKANINESYNFFMSDDYFTEMEKNEILSFPASNGVLFSELVNFVIKEKIDSGKNEICSSHDIAPVFKKVFGIQKGFENDKTYIKAKNSFDKNYNKKFNENS